MRRGTDIPDTTEKTYTGDRKLKRAIAKYGYKMTRAERAAFFDSLPERFSVYRMGKGHRRAYSAWPEMPIAFSSNHYIVEELEPGSTWRASGRVKLIGKGGGNGN